MDDLEFVCGGIDGKKRFLHEFTGRGADVSLGFVIKNLSPNAKTLLITLDDMFHPIKNFTHWVAWNIPTAVTVPKVIQKV